MLSLPQIRLFPAILIFAIVAISASCQWFNFNSKANINANASNETASPASETFAETPFPTKEPEKFRAQFVFSSKLETTDENQIEQTTEVFRDGLKRRIDFELSEKITVSRLQTADGKECILIPARKVYAEITTNSKNLPPNLPEDYSLEHLLHTKPTGAKYEKIGTENLNGKTLTKYRLDFGSVTGDAALTTETYLWVDESLGFPVKTEVVALANNQPTGAKSVMEMRDFSTEIAAETFEIPKDWRKVSVKEIQNFLRN